MSEQSAAEALEDDHSSRPPLPVWEFIGIVAGLMALNALAIDIMLPALPQMQLDFQFTDDNHRQRVVTFYVMGLGLSQIFYGPLMDRFGRKPILGVALFVYVAAGIACLIAPEFETLLLARAIQGASAGATRVVAGAVVRDFYAGRRMAQIMSTVMMIFMIAPIIAPSLGMGLLIAFDDWQAVFWGLIVYGVVIGGWAMIRLPETLDPKHRRPLNLPSTLSAYGEVLSTRVAAGYMIASAGVFSTLFSYVASSEQLFSEVYGLTDSFPLWFAGVAACMGVSNLMNSRLVMRFGMRRLSHSALIFLLCVNVVHAILAASGMASFMVFYTLMMLSFLMIGFIGPNFTATAMEPMGHMIGIASALYGCMTTLGSGYFGGVIADQFNGNTSSVFIGNSIAVLVSLIAVFVAERGRLFEPKQT